MSYEIFYKRAFIKVGDDAYIPVVQHGSNNCSEFNHLGREVSEKHWDCLNYPNKGKFIFTAEELKAWAKVYDAYGEHHKSRHTCFKEGEMARWLVNGMKSALSLEVYIQCGNMLCVTNWSNWDDQQHYYPCTTEGLLNVIDSHKGVNELSFHFSGKDLYLRKRQKALDKLHRAEKVSHFYILSNPEVGNFYGLKPGGYLYTSENVYHKKFKTEKAAAAYLKRYADRLAGFSVQEIQKEAYL